MQFTMLEHFRNIKNCVFLFIASQLCEDVIWRNFQVLLTIRKNQNKNSNAMIKIEYRIELQ